MMAFLDIQQVVIVWNGLNIPSRLFNAGFELICFGNAHERSIHTHAIRSKAFAAKKCRIYKLHG
jgi:hypothetical protein